MCTNNDCVTQWDTLDYVHERKLRTWFMETSQLYVIPSRLFIPLPPVPPWMHAEKYIFMIFSFLLRLLQRIKSRWKITNFPRRVFPMLTHFLVAFVFFDGFFVQSKFVNKLWHTWFKMSQFDCVLLYVKLPLYDWSGTLLCNIKRLCLVYSHASYFVDASLYSIYFFIFL